MTPNNEAYVGNVVLECGKIWRLTGCQTSCLFDFPKTITWNIFSSNWSHPKSKFQGYKMIGNANEFMFKKICDLYLWYINLSGVLQTNINCCEIIDGYSCSIAIYDKDIAPISKYERNEYIFVTMTINSFIYCVEFSAWQTRCLMGNQSHHVYEKL